MWTYTGDDDPAAKMREWFGPPQLWLYGKIRRPD